MTSAPTASPRRLFDIDAIKGAVDLADVVRAAGVDLKRRHGEWVGICPFHGEKSPSFTIFEKGTDQLFKCFGCKEGGDVINFVEKFHRVTTFEALKLLAGKTGLDSLPAPAGVRGPKPPDEAEERKKRRKVEMARDLYKAGEKNHPVIAAYLKSRGIEISKTGFPPALRYHPEVLNTETGELLPAMLAPVLNAKRQMISLHRTYLLADGSGKAEVEKPKMCLGSFAGGFVPLFETGDSLNIAEGIETALSVRMLGGVGAFWTCIALDNMRNLPIPPQVRTVTIWADNDMKVPEAGQRDPRDEIQRAARAIRELSPDRRVFIKWPPMGMDFNDVLVKGLSI